MTETQQRFLRAIAERVPAGNVVEVHLFPPIRQGGVETGVAVVAEDPRASPAASATEPGVDAVPQDAVEHTDSVPGDNGAAPAEVAAEPAAELPDVDAAAPAEAPEAPAVAAPERPNRYTVHTARYRLTLKGPDRGKWEVDVVAEADAPLEAVDAVVRGVLRRSGDGADPDRLTAAMFREALDAPLATLER